MEEHIEQLYYSLVPADGSMASSDSTMYSSINSDGAVLGKSQVCVNNV